LVWFHAPSVGESLQALPVVQRLRGDSVYAGQIAMTWFSPSAEPFSTRFDADFRDYLAFDTARAARDALDALRPSALVYAKLDVWPVLTERAHSRNVPLGLISATLSAKSARRGRLGKALLADAYARLDLVGAIAADDAERLVELGVRRDVIRVTGDTRFDQAWERAQRPAGEASLISDLESDRPTLVAGSTWPPDEQALLQAWERIRGRVPEARLILAPHEPSPAHLGPLLSWARRLGLQAATLAQRPTDSTDVILVDRVGLLGDLYRLADVAFVGGAFHRAGIHSVLEPAAFGVPVLFGPHWHSSREAGGLIAASGALSVDGAAALAEGLGPWMADVETRGAAAGAARQYVQGGLGAAGRATGLVLELIGGSH
jgi:3-deoxy-D-manno-octulosonic-acid transferase